MRPLRALTAVLALALVPTAAFAQPAPSQPPPASQPSQQLVVVVLPFEGNATQDLIDDAEAAVRNALLSRGARVPERSAVMGSMGVDAPRDPRSAAGFGRVMSATHVLMGRVRPLSGQYSLALTLVEVPGARNAQREANVGGDDADVEVRGLLTALFDPTAMGPAPLDPDEERRRQEAETRRQAEERARAEQARRDEAARRARAEEAAHPLRSFREGGPLSFSAGLQLGGLLSGTRAAPSNVISGAAPSDPSSFALMLRGEGAWAIAAVPGLEVHGALLLMTTPTSAFGLGGGAQFTFPATSRGRLRATAGATVGLFQGLSGARITTLWFEPWVRAQYEFTPTLAAVAGLSLDVAPGDNGGITALSFAAGVRFRVDP